MSSAPFGKPHRPRRLWAARGPALTGALLLTLIALSCVTVSWWSPYDGDRSDMASRYLPPVREHLLGTDGLGRDLLTRILHGGRISLAVGLLATGMGISLGTSLGSVAGLLAGWADNLIMRAADVFLSLPRIIVLIMMTVLLRELDASLLGPAGGVAGIAVILGLLSWMGVARQVRAQLLVLKEGDFVLAARAVGAAPLGVLWRHLLPNAWTPVIVSATLRIGGAVLAEAGLSFLGFGVQPPTPSWGNLLANGLDELLKGHYWLVVFPGLFIFLTVIAINFLGDGLRDALDPHKAPYAA